VGAACTGFLAALDLGAATVEAGRADVSLVIGAELMSRLLDLDDRRTAGLFGDGAGAAVITPVGAGRIRPIRMRADGSGAPAVTATHTENVIRMDGRATFRAAVTRLAEVTREVVTDAGRTLDDVDLFVYHQANTRILGAVGERLGLDPARVVDSIATHGNTSAASIPLALDAAMRAGRIGPASRVFLGAFGAGFTWGGGLLEWENG
jgi:3-oxoacyl-[acyl-carrier-protein] synthase-3